MNEQIKIENDTISKAALAVVLEMINFWKPGISAEALYVFMRTKTDNCDVLVKAAEYWSIAIWLVQIDF